MVYGRFTAGWLRLALVCGFRSGVDELSEWLDFVLRMVEVVVPVLGQLGIRLAGWLKLRQQWACV